jgi:hypothetical protein
MSIHTHTQHSLHKKLSRPSKRVNDHQIQHSITVLCKPDKCWSETVIRSDIHNNVSCCTLTPYSTPTYHSGDPKYCLPTQENPLWKNCYSVHPEASLTHTSPMPWGLCLILLTSELLPFSLVHIYRHFGEKCCILWPWQHVPPKCW